MDQMLDGLSDGLAGPDVVVEEPRLGSSRLAHSFKRVLPIEQRVARIPGARYVPARGGVAPIIVIDDGEAAEAGGPVWLAVTSGDGQVAALQAGAVGVVAPSASGERLAAAIDAARLGYAVVPAEVLRRLLPAEVRPLADGPGLVNGPSLTPREQSVLQLLSEGATNKMIARALDISVHTAKFHVASILEKLDAVTRTDAVAQGIRQGLLML
jgi:DNA-binding CsgD family transcriptional regulator